MEGHPSRHGAESRGQNTVSLGDMPHFPATVTDSDEKGGRLVLETIGDDDETDVIVFPDDTPARRRGETA